MENKLNALSELVDRLVVRIKNARENNEVSKIEVDIMLDLLRQTYLAVEELRNTGTHSQVSEGATVKQVVEKQRPQIEKVTEDKPVEKTQAIETPEPYAVPEMSEIPALNEPVIEPTAPIQAEVPGGAGQETITEPSFSHPPVTEKHTLYNEPVAETRQPAEEPVHQKEWDKTEIIQPVVVPIDEVPVMSFPKVEVEPEKPATFSNKVYEHEAPHVNQTVIPEPEPVKQAATPPVAAASTVRHTPETPQSERFASTPPVQKTTKSPGDLFASQTIGDKLRNETQSVNEKITQGRTDQSLGHKMQLKPISDLRTAIGINEKFQFVNDLFEGRIDLYNDSIGDLNTCGSGMIAERMLDEMKSQHNWNENAEAYNKLKTFVTRRYL